jgi:hypothetical protein
MTRHLVLGLLISLLVVVADKSAAADGTPVVYDTVDSLQLRGFSIIRVTGIISGEGAQSVHDYSLISGSVTSPEYAARCDRLALLAMSKPGKYQFTLTALSGGSFGCSLTVRAP